jgi:hypothetical protein
LFSKDVAFILTFYHLRFAFFTISKTRLANSFTIGLFHFIREMMCPVLMGTPSNDNKHLVTFWMGMTARNAAP